MLLIFFLFLEEVFPGCKTFLPAASSNSWRKGQLAFPLPCPWISGGVWISGMVVATVALAIALVAPVAVVVAGAGSLVVALVVVALQTGGCLLVVVNVKVADS